MRWRGIRGRRGLGIETVEEGKIGLAEISPFVNERQTGNLGVGVTHAIAEVELGGVAAAAEAEKGSQGDALMVVPEGYSLGAERLEIRGRRGPSLHRAGWGCPRRFPSPN